MKLCRFLLNHPKIYLQVQGIKEDDQVLSLVVVQADFLELSVDDSRALESGSLLLQLRSHFNRFT